MREPAGMTKKGITVLKRTGAEVRSIYRFIEAGRNRIWLVWSGRDSVIFWEGIPRYKAKNRWANPGDQSGK